MKRALLLAVICGLFGLNFYHLANSRGAHAVDAEAPAYKPTIIKAAVLKQLRDPASASFGSMDIYDDRQWAGRKATVVCGSVNAKNGFGGYSGMKNFVYLQDLNIAEIDSGRNNGGFVRTWNKLCAGKHTGGQHIDAWLASKF